MYTRKLLLRWCSVFLFVCLSICGSIKQNLLNPLNDTLPGSDIGLLFRLKIIHHSNLLVTALHVKKANFIIGVVSLSI